MDFDKLRDALVQKNKESGTADAEEIEDADDLGQHIRIQLGKLTGRLTEATDTGERNRIIDRQKLAARWLAELRNINLMPEAARESRRQQLRAVVLEELSKWNLGGEKHRQREAQIELGHKHVQERAKPGALTHAHKRIKDEIEYLLKNYTPSNDYKIETLIDKWRTSGDPGYDPSIKLRLRQARRKKNDSDYAL